MPLPTVRRFLSLINVNCANKTVFSDCFLLTRAHRKLLQYTADYNNYMEVPLGLLTVVSGVTWSSNEWLDYYCYIQPSNTIVISHKIYSKMDHFAL